jgi:hypothetical protein
LAGQLAANHPDDALQYFRGAINRGYEDADGLMAEPDPEKLRPNSNCQQLVAELKTHARKGSAQQGFLRAPVSSARTTAVRGHQILPLIGREFLMRARY